MMRGLTIDKARGNVLKVDRHKYVKIAFHGFRQMTKGEKQAMYAQGTQRHSFDTDDFTTIDTLFSLAEAYLFMQVPSIQCCLG
jgi:5' nucleotidase family